MKKFIILLALFSLNPAFAGEGAMGLSGGTLVFGDLAGVSMEKQSLYISETEVQVRYELINQTTEPISARVAFPVHWKKNCSAANFDADSDHPLDFTLQVDGQAVVYQTRGKLNGQAGERCRDFTMEYFWNQSFPPDTKIVIEQSYRPILDSSDHIAAQMSNEEWDEVFGYDLEGFYCAEEDQVSLVKVRDLSWKGVNHIQKTANTWDGPIKEFELTLDKGKRPMLFLCTEIEIFKVKGKRQFHGVMKNFTATSDFNIAFVDKFNF